jgi:hypothetical protein
VLETLKLSFRRNGSKLAFQEAPHIRGNINMKSQTPLVALSLLFLALLPARSELVIYHGTATESVVGLGRRLSLPFQMYYVIDSDTGTFTEIAYRNYRSSKQYYTTLTTNVHIVTAVAPAGKTWTGISHVLNTCDTAEGYVNEGVLLQGINGSLPVSSNSVISFPGQLTSESHGYSPGGSYSYNTSRKAAFDRANTIVSNNAGETMDQAVARLSGQLEKSGYSPQSLAKGELFEARFLEPLASAPSE